MRIARCNRVATTTFPRNRLTTLTKADNNFGFRNFATLTMLISFFFASREFMATKLKEVKFQLPTHSQTHLPSECYLNARWDIALYLRSPRSLLILFIFYSPSMYIFIIILNLGARAVASVKKKKWLSRNFKKLRIKIALTFLNEKLQLSKLKRL